MEWGEAIRLLQKLQVDPSTMFAASVRGWDFPLSREAAALLDLFDLQHASKAKRRPKPHPGRPWRTRDQQQRRGNAAGRSTADVVEILRRNARGASGEHAALDR